MKDLKNSIKKVEEKYITAEVLSDADKKSTYGGATSDGGFAQIMYGVPTTKYGVPITKYGIVPILKYGIPVDPGDDGPIISKYGVPPILKYGIKPMYGVPDITLDE